MTITPELERATLIAALVSMSLAAAGVTVVLVDFIRHKRWRIWRRRPWER